MVSSHHVRPNVPLFFDDNKKFIIYQYFYSIVRGIQEILHFWTGSPGVQKKRLPARQARGSRLSFLPGPAG
jgi:hypothetical protein